MKNMFLIALLGLGALPLAAQVNSFAGAPAVGSAGKFENAVSEAPNIEAMLLLARTLQASGRWQGAIPVLEKLVQLRPQDAAVLYQLGSIKSWQPGNRIEALALLRRACETSARNAEYCGAYAEVLSWSDESRAQAIVELEQALAANPADVSQRVRLAQMLSWNASTRAQALQIFDQGLQLDPSNVELLVASAEVLSWNGCSRPEAMVRYDRVLKQNPQEPRALTGKAQLLAWQNHSQEALTMYRLVLAKDPKNPAALRGEAEILNWRGHYTEARDLALSAHTADPSDERADLELARADIGLKDYAAAKQVLSGVNGTPSPDFDEARNQVHRGLGTYLDMGYAFREQPNHRPNNLEFHRFDLALSTPVGAGSRVTFAYQPTLYNSFVQGFNSNAFAASIDTSWSDRASGHAQFGAEVFQGVPYTTNVYGGAGLSFRPTYATTLRVNFEREPVQESLLSTEGQATSGVFYGQVFSNLASVGIGYESSAHKFDVSVDYSDGLYSGRNLDANRRYSIDFQIGKALHSDQPYVRVGYFADYTSFGYDADFGNEAAPNRTGVYFSPTSFLLNEGVLTVSHRFNKGVQWGMSGGAGAQNVEAITSSFSNAQFASSFETHLFWRVTPTNELRFGYDYLNVFNAFQRNLFRFSWRYYF